MKTADLYIRVSTDEQAEKGFSVKYQEDLLRRHCLINSIQVQNIYFEDFSCQKFQTSYVVIFIDRLQSP